MIFSFCRENRLSFPIVTALIMFPVLLPVKGADPAMDGIHPARLKGWVIEVDDASIPAEKYAAEELQKFLAEATGQTLKIVSGTESGSAGRILIGQAATRSRYIRFNPADYGDEDLRIAVNPGEIVITGGKPRGTLYGVYTFLEDYLGVRFLTADHTHVPKVDASQTIPVLDRTFRPVIPWRYTYYGEIHENHPFAVRLRQNAIATDDRLGGQSEHRLFNHSVSRLLPWKTYGATHPEYFCLRDGKRPEQLMNHQTYEIQPCFSNPEARRIMLENLLIQIRKEYPKWKDFSVSQDDNGSYCTCPQCAALDEKAESHCGQLLDFVNWIAGEVKKQFPDVTIGTLIYQWSRIPPKNMKPASNVKLQLCSIECCQIHPIDDPECPLNRKFQEDLANWAKLTDNIAVWHYNVNFMNYLVPCPNLFNLERNVRYFVRNHANGIFMQCAAGTTGAEFSELRNYAIGNLLWDPDRNGEALIEEFLRLHYGPSAPPIRRFLDRVRDAALKSGKHRNCFALADRYGLTPQLGQQGIEDFNQALALAPDEEIRDRVEKASIPAWRLAIEPVAIALMDGKKLSAEEKAEYRPVVEHFLKLCRKHGIKLVTERTRLEDAEKALSAILADESNPPILDPALMPFANALQKVFDLIQHPEQPMQVDMQMTIEQREAEPQSAELQLIRMDADSFQAEGHWNKKHLRVQCSPTTCFIYAPDRNILIVGTGELSPGTRPLNLNSLEQAVVRIEKQADPYIRILKTVNGQTAVAMMAMFGIRVQPVNGSEKKSWQFEIRLGGGNGRILFAVDPETEEFRKLCFQGQNRTISADMKFSQPDSLPPVPTGISNPRLVPRAQLEAGFSRLIEILLRNKGELRNLKKREEKGDNPSEKFLEDEIMDICT